MLLYFLIGIAFAQWLLPIGDAIANLIISFLEMLKGKTSVQITKMNVDIQKITDSAKEGEVVHRQIGFCIDPEEEEEGEEEDDNDL